MKPTIKYGGFTPTDEIVLIAAGIMDKLQEASPYDSAIEVLIGKGEREFTMEVRVSHAGGTFESSAAGTQLPDLIFRTVEAVLTQLTHWVKNRNFEELAESDWSAPFALPYLDWPDQAGPKPLHVLIVDDDVESIIPLRQCLQKLGCQTNIVTSGFDAIHELLSGERDYDIVFLDWQMPEMSGVQALQNAQKVIAHAPSVKEHWNNYQLPVIMYSSRPASEVDVPECRDFKFLDHWEKSIPYSSLFEKVSDAFLELKKMPVET